MPRPGNSGSLGLAKFPERDYAEHGCRVLMLAGKPLVDELPKLGPPPKAMTDEEIRVWRSIRGDRWLAGQR